MTNDAQKDIIIADIENIIKGLQHSVIFNEITIKRMEHDQQLANEKMAREIDILEQDQMLVQDRDRRTIKRLEQELTANRCALKRTDSWWQATYNYALN